MTHGDQWRLHAACAGADTDAWFPARGDNGATAIAVCAECPVVVDCLLSAVEHREEYGIHGGAGASAKRLLFRLWRARTHSGYLPGCTCPWCIGVTGHLARIRGEEPGPIRSYGPGATHGRKSTYTKGCRCDLCHQAISTRSTHHNEDEVA